MKKSFFLAFSVFCFFSASKKLIKPKGTTAKINKDAGPVAEAPKAETIFLKETEYDFGKIPQGKPVTHVFEVINKGKDSLKIANVQASCGCTTHEWDRNVAVPTNKSTNINVGFNAGNEGPFNKTITITYNGNESTLLRIKGEVWKTPTTSAPENKNLNDFKN
jgi:Protein of unknown function (DUF1573)